MKGHFGSSDMRRLLQLGRERNLFLACLRAGTFALWFALTVGAGLTASQAAQVTIVPPFVGTHSETWERFGVSEIPSGTSILGGIATIMGTGMLTEHKFRM